MKTISEEERKTATLIPVDSILSDVDDTEAAFSAFRASFDSSEEPGSIKAWELQIDERGNIGTTRTQNRLGSWPIDAYTFDQICQMLIDQYMTPDQNRMAVRLVGVSPKQSGFVFNKIVMLKRALKKESSSNGSDSTGSLLKMLQEMNERNLAMFSRLQAPAEKPDTAAEIQKMMAFAQAMNAPMLGVLQTLLPALAGRPVASAGNPFEGLTGILDVAERLSEFRGGGGGDSGGDDNSFAGILRAVTPLVKPALEALPAVAAMAQRRPPQRPAIQGQPARPPANPTAIPTQPTHVEPPGPAPIQPNDIPSGDRIMLEQLKPQVDSLVQMASQGSDAVGTADLIFDQVFLNLKDEDYERLANFVDNPQFLNYVKLINPAASAHGEWFAAFQAQIVKHLNADDTQEPTPGQWPTPGSVASAN